MKNNKLEIAPDTSFTQKSNYDWVNIINGKDRVGKARTKISLEKLIINSIQIYPQYRGKGFGKEYVYKCKNEYSVIIADKVRNSARKFWHKMGFKEMVNGNYKWKKIN